MMTNKGKGTKERGSRVIIPEEWVDLGTEGQGVKADSGRSSLDN